MAISLPVDDDGTPLERATKLAGRIAKAALEAAAFLRLGLLHALERRPEEPSARAIGVPDLSSRPSHPAEARRRKKHPPLVSHGQTYSSSICSAYFA
jgi:hypothetical protein